MNLTLRDVKSTIEAIDKFDDEGDYVRAHCEEDTLLKRFARAVFQSTPLEYHTLHQMSVEITKHIVGKNENYAKRYFWHWEKETPPAG